MADEKQSKDTSQSQENPNTPMLGLISSDNAAEVTNEEKERVKAKNDSFLISASLMMDKSDAEKNEMINRLLGKESTALSKEEMDLQNALIKSMPDPEKRQKFLEHMKDLEPEELELYQKMATNLNKANELRNQYVETMREAGKSREEINAGLEALHNSAHFSGAEKEGKNVISIPASDENKTALETLITNLNREIATVQQHTKETAISNEPVTPSETRAEGTTGRNKETASLVAGEKVAEKAPPAPMTSQAVGSEDKAPVGPATSTPQGQKTR